MFREDITLEELLAITELLHKIKPSLKDYVCTGIEIPHIDDKNVVFHMASKDDQKVEMIAANYFI